MIALIIFLVILILFILFIVFLFAGIAKGLDNKYSEIDKELLKVFKDYDKKDFQDGSISSSENSEIPASDLQ